MHLGKVFFQEIPSTFWQELLDLFDHEKHNVLHITLIVMIYNNRTYLWIPRYLLLVLSIFVPIMKCTNNTKQLNDCTPKIIGKIT